MNKIQHAEMGFSHVRQFLSFLIMEPNNNKWCPTSLKFVTNATRPVLVMPNQVPCRCVSRPASTSGWSGQNAVGEVALEAKKVPITCKV